MHDAALKDHPLLHMLYVTKVEYVSPKVVSSAYSEHQGVNDRLKGLLELLGLRGGCRT